MLTFIHFISKTISTFTPPDLSIFQFVKITTLDRAMIDSLDELGYENIDRL